MAALQILVDRQNSAVTLALLGELDMAEVDAFEDELRRIEQSHPPLIAIDLSALELIDSYGLSTLLDAEARAREAGRRLVLVPPPDQLMRVFRLTLLDRRFEWIDPAASRARDGPRRLARSCSRPRGRVARVVARSHRPPAARNLHVRATARRAFAGQVDLAAFEEREHRGVDRVGSLDVRAAGPVTSHMLERPGDGDAGVEAVEDPRVDVRRTADGRRVAEVAGDVAHGQ